MTWSLGSVAAAVLDLVQDVPTDVSGSLPAIANMACITVGNILREGIGSNSIPENRYSLVANTTAMLTLGRMHNVGLDFNWTLGQWSVAKGTSSPVAAQISLFAGLINNELKTCIYNRAIFSKCNG
jgi:hypothetical protein